MVALDTPPPARLEERDLVDALDVSWGLDVGEITYVPKGAGSYHWTVEVGGQPTCFVTVDDLDAKPWIGTTRESTFEGLEAAYQAAWVLNHDVGLAFVVGPVRTENGSTVVRVSDQFTVAVFPFIEGRAGNWGEPLTPLGHTALCEALAKLHSPTLVDARISPRPLDLPERASLIDALDRLDRPWEGGPLSGPARAVMAAHAQNITDWLRELEALAGRVGELEDRVVVTHGEPHPGNLIHTADGLRLIDWDTVALARPERDLWMLDDGSPEPFARYEDATGIRISDAAINFYRLAWTLSDIASFSQVFRSAHEDSHWIRNKWAAFQRLLGGAPSAPYGVTRQ